MISNTINKITVYKLIKIDICSVDIPEFTPVSRDVWKMGGNEYPYSLFFYNNKGPIKVSWLDVFEPLNIELEPDKTPKTIASGFIMLIYVGDSLFGLTGGVGHFHLLKHLEVEHRFGIDLAQRILSQSELSGLSQRDTSGIVNSLDRVFRGTYNPQGDINNLKRVLTHIRGKLKKKNSLYKRIGSSIKASDALTVCGQKAFKDIVAFLIEVDKLATKTIPKLRIPQLEHIDKKAHKELLKELDIQLVEVLKSYSSDEQESLFIDNEEIGYLPDRAQRFTLAYKHRRYDAETYHRVFEYIHEILSGIDSAEDRQNAFDRMNLSIQYDDGIWESKPLFYFLCGDIEYNDEIYFLNNRHWYKASVEYLSIMARELDNIEVVDPVTIGLLPWDKEKHKTETEFNNNQKGLVVLHEQLVKIREEKGGIEFCDLLKVSDEDIYIIHVKADSGAALRALFAQGYVSAKLFSESDEFRDKVIDSNFEGGKKLAADKRGVLKSLKNRQKREMKIVFAIFDEKKTHKVEPDARTTLRVMKGTFTTFAKVDLLDRVSNMRALGYTVVLTRIRPYP